MTILNERDLKQIAETGRSANLVKEQIRVIKQGKNFVELMEPATIENGRIIRINEFERPALEALWKDRVAKHSIKFIPASGAASRMFKALNFVASNKFENVQKIQTRIDELSVSAVFKHERDELGALKDFLIFWDKLKTFPFFAELSDTLQKNGLSIDKEIADGQVSNILKYLLTEKGMNYSAKPKLLLTFHLDSGNPRLAMEEHVKEAIWLCNGRLHFTLSPEFLPHATTLARHLEEIYRDKGFPLNISFSIQEPASDTVALTSDGEALHRNEDGSLFFRQSGHGALSLNLNRLGDPYILIQNVDNLPGGNTQILAQKRTLMGYFAKIEEEIFEWLRVLSADESLSDIDLENALHFVTNRINRKIEIMRFAQLDIAAKRKRLIDILNRPLVVAAMVPNKGEPGGGPFAVKDDASGDTSNQIVEQAQQNLSEPVQSTIAKGATHFNPVFLMVGTRNYEGDRFDLSKYARREGGYVFFVEKSDSKGRSFISIDTGLWNGEIADMNIVFVEMPLETFGPAKTILDLNPEIRPFRSNPYPEIIPEISPTDVREILSE